MIRKTLNHTQAATFAVLLPDPDRQGMPAPVGTGFFISRDGWFITAAHVVTNRDGGRRDIGQARLHKEIDPRDPVPRGCEHVSLEYVNAKCDVALLKVDFQKNRRKDWLKDKEGFPFLSISTRQLELGEPVYSFGYPLSAAEVHHTKQVTVGFTSLCPRVTSAIVASVLERDRMLLLPSDPEVYVLDKALNYGNSGGPIVAVATGNVHAFCSRFQPVYIPQPYISDQKGNPIPVMIPSLYGVVSGLQNEELVQKFKELGIPLSEV